MTSNRTIAVAAFLWTALAADLLMHAAMNDYLAVVVAAVGAVGWAAFYVVRRSAAAGALSTVKVVRRP